MQRVTLKEYTEAKRAIMSGGECREYSHVMGSRIHKTISCEDGHEFYEITENGETEFWSTKYPESRKYIDHKTKSDTYDEQKRDFIRLVINTTLTWLSDTPEAVGYLADSTRLFATCYEGKDMDTRIRAKQQVLENIAKTSALISDEIIEMICIGF